MRESFKDKKERAGMIFKRLKEMYPDATCALDFKTAWELLVATILSAQCTDKRVNIVTPHLFKKLPTVRDFAEVEQEELEEYIRSTGFYRNKAKNIKGAAKKVVEDFGGRVPDNMDELVTLPGIARKSGNVILCTWFKKTEGVTVDTHVKRLSGRLDLSNEKTPEKIEQDLMKLYPKSNWCAFSYMLVDHGRKVCDAKKPRCIECKLQDICPSAKNYL